VHHIPVCTSFYYIPGIEKPIVDANSKEERLATARLSICMNIFEDVCGVQTLGQMEVEPSQLIECAEEALEISKQVTLIVREAWEKKGNYSLTFNTELKNEVENFASA
jgi:exosome complex RNA-binding protein Rrp42 (RNase PH superfamily)